MTKTAHTGTAATIKNIFGVALFPVVRLLEEFHIHGDTFIQTFKKNKYKGRFFVIVKALESRNSAFHKTEHLIG
jgi:hypothetical protein